MESLTLREVATRYGYDLGNLRRLAGQPSWPSPAGKRSNAFVYDPAEVEAWLASRSPAEDEWTADRVAAELSVSVSAVKSARRRGAFPEPDGWWGQRPWWRPDTARAWLASRVVPDDAWTISEVRAHCDRAVPETLARLGLPDADGVALTGRWWRPETIRQWWAPEAERRAQRQRQRVEAEQKRQRLNDPERWYGRDVAANTGLSYETVRTYRRLGKMPDPDGFEGNRPWWRPDAIMDWGQPRGVGRPRVATASGSIL